MAWITFICLAGLHYLTLSKFDTDNYKKTRNIVWAVFFFFQFLWYSGIVIGFWAMSDNKGLHNDEEVAHTL